MNIGIKKTRMLAILVIILFSANTMISVNAVILPSLIYVNETGWWREGGNFNASSTPIQDAINNASDGDMVIVYDGIYHETVVIDKSITLKANSTPIIDCQQAGPCITINANNVVIEGFEILNGTYGIIGSPNGVDNVVINNNIIHDNVNTTGYDGIGIMFWTNTDGVDFDNISITNNQIYNNGRQGIFLGSMAGSPAISEWGNISGNVIYNNGNHPTPIDQYGIHLSYADNFIIANNEIYGHDDWSFANGIYLMASYNNVVRYNDIHDNKYGISQWSWTRSYAGSNDINYNNIYNNVVGVSNFDAVTINSEYNWWGDVSGPGGAGFGTGDVVSNNVDYDPWLDSPYPAGQPINFTGQKKSDVPAGTTEVDARDEADAGATINTNSPVSVTIARYSRNPGTAFAGDVGKYIDVHINNTTNVNSILIKMYYTDDEIAGLYEYSLRMYWWDGNDWIPCSNTGVNTENQNGYSGYIWAYIDDTTTPSLDQLQGSPFGGSGKPMAVPTLTLPGIIILVGSLAVIALLTLRK